MAPDANSPETSSRASPTRPILTVLISSPVLPAAMSTATLLAATPFSLSSPVSSASLKSRSFDSSANRAAILAHPPPEGAKAAIPFGTSASRSRLSEDSLRSTAGRPLELYAKEPLPSESSIWKAASSKRKRSDPTSILVSILSRPRLPVQIRPISSRLRNKPTPRMMYCCSPCSMYPPPEFMFPRCTALKTWERVTPRDRILLRSGTTWYCLM